MKQEFPLLRSVVARRIFGLLIICALLPVCVLTAISLAQVSSTIKKDSMDRLRHTSRNAGMAIVEGLYILETEFHSLAHTLSHATQVEIGSLDALKASGDERRLLGFTLFSRDGAVRRSLGKPCPPPVLSNGGRQHLAGGKVLLYGDPVTARSGRLFMALSHEQNLPGEGLLVVEINPDYLWTLVSHTLPPETDLCVIDPLGRPLFNSSSSLPHFIPRIMAKVRGSSVGHFEWNGAGQQRLVTYWSAFLRPLYHVDSWTVVTSQSTRDAFRPIHLFGRTFLLVVVLSLLIVSYLSSILVRRNLVPLAILRQGAQQLSQGELDARVTLHSGDEFQELADTFNTMADRLQRQFLSTRETGRVVQEFLAAHDRDTIVKVALSSRDKAVHCQTMALSLMDPAVVTLAMTHRSLADASAGSPPPEVATPFSEAELECLDGARNGHLHLTGSGEFSSLLLPMVQEGAHDFYLFPFFLRETFTGLLTIGYSHLPLQIRGDLARARHIADEIAVALDNLRLVDELNQLNWGTIGALATAVDAKSPWTAGHSERVTRLSLDIGRAMGLDKQELELLHLGGLFHDIGKIAVPEVILDKPGRLTDEEFALIRTHPQAGARILAPISAYERIIPVVEQHHEWFNGEGYPHGLAGDGISLGGRILAVADVYDALISDRPYRAGWEHGRVLSHIVGRAWSQFDPLVVEALLTVVASHDSVAAAAAPAESAGITSS